MSRRYPLFFLCVLFSLIPPLRCSPVNSLTGGEEIRDGDGHTLISPGRVFELGFFTPEGNSEKSRYLGIWYYGSNPKIVVWVANRDKPFLEPTGVLVIDDHNAKLLHVDGTTYWSTDSFGSSQPIKTASSVSTSDSPYLMRLCLSDDGNLILKGWRDQGFQTLWQSFVHPTDTLLPGMSLDGSLNLISWDTSDNPAPGNFTLLLQPGTGAEKELFVSRTGVPDYWDSGVSSSDKIPRALSNLLNPKDSNASEYRYSRLVLNFAGQVQFWISQGGRGWSLIWWEPKDRCGLRNPCGSFGSCNSNNKLPCKCLPGYKPSLLEEWNSGCFSGGCLPKSGAPFARKDFLSDKFLSLSMMKVAKPNHVFSEEDCESICRQDIHCVAYSCGNSANCTQTATSVKMNCSMWFDELTGLQEEYPDGLTIFIRTARSDIEPTFGSCNPCGAYLIPYPLSTAANCGDSSYSNFHCNAATGQLNFSTPSGTFRVNSMDPDKKTFTIQVPHANSCDHSYMEFSVLSPKLALPFNVFHCNIVEDLYSVVKQSFIEVEMEWEPPQEPACNVSSDCLGWLHTTCKAAKEGKMRCICGSKFRWDGRKLGCTRVLFPFKVLILCIAGALAIVLLCAVFFIRHIQKRRITERQGSFVSKEDDGEAIDVPFFTWESILAATNNFADANKLGTGGFGPVYKGKLPDGKEIAVKRLSTVSVQGVEEFKTEVVLIAKLQHRNLVRLLGYCVNADEKILIYEYMPNGSLDSCLFDQTCSVFLDWKKRSDIILGVARGLLYLHEDSRLRIIHRDLKPSNILLDDELNPKISDFGTAKIVGGKETEASTGRIVGTYGYMSPEYAYEGLFSIKSDVFSFGMVVLETISSRRNSRSSQLKHGISLLGHAWRLWSENRAMDLMDQTLRESCNETEVLKYVHIGLLCVQRNPIYRPTMSTVLLMLGSEYSSLPLPKEPAFITSDQSSETTFFSSPSDLSLNDSITFTAIGR